MKVALIDRLSDGKNLENINNQYLLIFVLCNIMREFNGRELERIKQSRRTFQKSFETASDKTVNAHLDTKSAMQKSSWLTACASGGCLAVGLLLPQYAQTSQLIMKISDGLSKSYAESSKLENDAVLSKQAFFSESSKMEQQNANSDSNNIESKAESSEREFSRIIDSITNAV